VNYLIFLVIFLQALSFWILKFLAQLLNNFFDFHYLGLIFLAIFFILFGRNEFKY
tara:strand:+ start:360 stop:524 length:165 start_codon:yes stop_codon:yes gene_type:complete